MSEEIAPRPRMTTALDMYLQAIEAVHRERTIAFCYCAVGSSLRIVEATDEYHFPGLVMATPTDAGTLADQLNHERLGLSRQQAATIIGQSWAFSSHGRTCIAGGKPNRLGQLGAQLGDHRLRPEQRRQAPRSPGARPVGDGGAPQIARAQ